VVSFAATAQQVPRIHHLNLPKSQETVMQFLNLISRAQLCERLGVSPSTINRWVKTRNFPSPMKASGRRSLFDLSLIEQWIKNLESNND